jgi:polar amino acid transport system substrate-binding protein
MRKSLLIAIAVVITAGLSACGSSDKPAANEATTTTSGTGTGPCGKAPIPAEAADFEPLVDDTLSVVTSLPGPGFWEGSDTDPTKLTSGYEYDIAKCMEEAFGLNKMTVRNVSFDAIEAGTVTNYDIILSQISITAERAKVMSFSEPYFESEQGILMRSDSEPIVTADEAKRANWGVQTGTTANDLLDLIGATDIHTYQSLADAYTALQAKQVDAVLIDTAINLGQAARSDGKLKVVAQFNQPSGPDQYGAALPKNSPNVDAVNAVFKSMKDSGELQALVERDLTVDPATLKTIPVIKVTTTT